MLSAVFTVHLWWQILCNCHTMHTMMQLVRSLSVLYFMAYTGSCIQCDGFGGLPLAHPN